MISRMRAPVLVLLAIGFACPSVFAQAAPPATPGVTERTGNPENGKKVFINYYCYACHGTVGQGGRDGARIAPNPPSIATITRYIRKPTGQMPPYTSKVLSDQDIADIYAFLKTIPASPAPRNIPLLNQ
jgi:ubiquinol-cytochrome c reductase cytochrome c subunit